MALTINDAKSYGLLLLYAAGALVMLLGPVFTFLVNMKASRIEAAAATAAAKAAAAAQAINEHRQQADTKLSILAKQADTIVEKNELAIRQNVEIEKNVNHNVSSLFEVVNKLVATVGAFQQESADTRKQLADLLAKSVPAPEVDKPDK